MMARKVQQEITAAKRQLWGDMAINFIAGCLFGASITLFIQGLT